MHTSDGAELTVVTDTDERAGAIKARRTRLGLSLSGAAAESKRLAELKRLARGIDRGTIGDAERGVGSDETYAFLDTLYDVYQETLSSPGVGDEEAASRPITVKFAGNFGVQVTVQGSVEDEAALERLTAAILREMRSEGGPE